MQKIEWKFERNRLRQCGVLLYGAQKRKKKKRDGRGKTDSYGRKLTFRFESVGPARTSFSTVKVGEKPAAIRALKHGRRNEVGGLNEGVTICGRREKADDR